MYCNTRFKNLFKKLLWGTLFVPQHLHSTSLSAFIGHASAVNYVM